MLLKVLTDPWDQESVPSVQGAVGLFQYNGVHPATYRMDVYNNCCYDCKSRQSESLLSYLSASCHPPNSFLLFLAFHYNLQFTFTACCFVLKTCFTYPTCHKNCITVSINNAVWRLLQALPDPLGWAVPVSWVHPDPWRSARPLGQPCKPTCRPRASGRPAGVPRLPGEGVCPSLYQCSESGVSKALSPLLFPTLLQPLCCLSSSFPFWDLQFYVLPQLLLTHGSPSPLTITWVLGRSSSSWSCSSKSDP